MSEFFTWSALATCAGATLFVTLVTQLFKGVGFVERIPTRLFAYGVALATLLCANLFAGSLTLDTAALCAVNAAVVSLAANGAHDAAVQMRSKAE